MHFNSDIMASCTVCVWCRNVVFSINTQGISRIFGTDLARADDVFPEVDVAEPEPVSMPFEPINESVEVVDEVKFRTL